MKWWQVDSVIERFKLGDRTIFVVREDLAPGGSKIRFLPYLVQGAREIVYGTPFCGGAQLALAEYGKREGVAITLFTAKRKELHPWQLRAKQAGAHIAMVPHGYMSNVQSKAKAYSQQSGGLFLPLGFDKPEATGPFIGHIRKVADGLPIDEVWCATGSGMLAKCIGAAMPLVHVHGVVVGLKSRNAAQRLTNNVTLHSCPYDFAKESKAATPFPASGNYEKKAWEQMLSQARGKNILFWNVMG